MVDKATTIPRVKVGNRIGQVDTLTLSRVSQALTAFLDLG
jgi:mRNA-degrading endonuclease toxin of MazEF toxin-antitoxin module